MSDNSLREHQKNRYKFLTKEKAVLKTILKSKSRKRAKKTNPIGYQIDKLDYRREDGLYFSDDSNVNTTPTPSLSSLLGYDILGSSEYVDNARDIFNTVNTIKKNLRDTSAIAADLIDTGEHRFTAVYNAIKTNPLKVAVDDLKKYLTQATNDPDAVDDIIAKLDLNKDDVVDESELDAFAKIENTTVVQRILNDPGFRAQIVQRRPYSSIYKDDFSAYNQVEAVMQSFAQDTQTANFGNAAFE